MPTLHRRFRFATVILLAVCLLLPGLLGGCAAVAVSLAGAGAGAGLSHQINGQASRTFSEPLTKVDDAARIAARKMLLEVSEVSSTENGQLTKARVSGLDITVELETLSPTLTRVDVIARKNIFRVDGATAQEIVSQIERALDALSIQEATAANEAARSTAKATELAPAPASRKNSKRKSSI